MSELPDPTTAADAARYAGTGTGSSEAQGGAERAGALLRQTREAHGLHADAMAFSLKVPVAKLMALEAGRLDLLPDLTFARGLAASICRNLKVDPTPVLALLPRSGSARLGSDKPPINTPFRPPGSGPNFSLRGRMLSPAVLAVVVLLIGALLVVVWPRMHEEADVLANSGVPATGDMAPGPVANPSAPSVEPLPSAVMPGSPAPTAAVAPPAGPAPSLAAVPAGASASAASGAAAAFVLNARADTWVKVTDAKGAVQVNRLVKAGENVQADGVAPLAVVIGRADAVQVQVRGQPF
ncbi:MAG: hypothetical protein JWQ88_1201, partial [Rhodoferax sp.]|nr:hypothetical protein [Rhodoferax sp.]